MWNKNIITANRYLVKEDAARIENYIKRRGWHSLEGDGGLKYIMLSSPGGDSITQNPKFSMRYRIELLDGSVCYDDEKEMVYGSSEMDAGLHRTFINFRHNDSIALILPPHYAKGLIGDLDKIPPHSVIVYYLKIK
jgi:FKBP-type peptidyl-prolyl cis-trans isomerase